MEAKDVIDIFQLIKREGIDVWLDGGWCVDALLGGQTRRHEDVDIVVQQRDVPKLRELLEARGYKDVERDDTSDWNFVLGDSKSHLVDVHAIVFDAEGNGLYGPPEKGVMYPAAALTGSGKIEDHSFKCISPEYMVKFKTEYELDENGRRDLSALCERFGMAYPRDFRRKP